MVSVSVVFTLYTPVAPLAFACASAASCTAFCASAAVVFSSVLTLTFYVDNLYVFEPLPYVKNMYYLDVNFYRYYIGRQDQSVNETVMISRIDQQIRVTKLMIDYLVAKKQELVKNRRLYQYMRNYLEIIMTVSSVLLIRSGTQEHLDKKKELWEYLKSKDKRLYLWMRNGIMGGTMNLPGRGGRKISVEGYKICQKLFGFN